MLKFCLNDLETDNICNITDSAADKGFMVFIQARNNVVFPGIFLSLIYFKIYSYPAYFEYSNLIVP